MNYTEHHLVAKTPYFDIPSCQYKGVKITPKGYVAGMSAKKDICFGILQNSPYAKQVAFIAPLFCGRSSYIYLSEQIDGGELVTINNIGEATKCNLDALMADGLLETGGQKGELGVIRLGSFRNKGNR